MGSRAQTGWLVGAVALGAALFGWMFWRATLQVRQDEQARQIQPPPAAPAPMPVPPPLAGKPGYLFDHAQVYAFLDKAKQAEAIKDPLKRCLAYPDPPGSHWTPAAVGAYCRYRTQAVMSFADMQALIEGGHAAELDRRLQALLDAQATQPGARGLLDRTYDMDFDASLDIRPALDAWKRDSPKSAFAYAASGVAYSRMAFAARGEQYINQTPVASIEAMDRLAEQADGDLRQAIAMNPRVTPSYVAMINLGGMSLGDDYADQAARRGLAVDPANFAIYDMMLWRAQPAWGGSLPLMASIARAAMAHAADNPMLALLTTKEPALQVNLDVCNCHTRAQLAMYPLAFDQVSTPQLLAKAGEAAMSSHELGLAVVYLSEALRFDSHQPDERLHRIYLLDNFDESQWAVNEATAMLKTLPGNEAVLSARGFSYLTLNDDKHAEQDYARAMAVNPADENALMQLASLYMNQRAQWDKAWDLSTRAQRLFPNDPAGWILQVEIERRQPHAGLAHTVDDFAARFGSNPAQHKMLLWMRAQLALQQGAHYRPAPAVAAGLH